MILLVGNGGTHLPTELCHLARHLLQKDVIISLVKMLFVHATRTAVTLLGIFLAVVMMVLKATPQKITILSTTARLRFCAVNLRVLSLIHQLVELCLKMLLMLF